MILPICIMKKNKSEVSCKLNLFGYWNSCKCLPNFLNMTSLGNSEGSDKPDQIGISEASEETAQVRLNLHCFHI